MIGGRRLVVLEPEMIVRGHFSAEVRALAGALMGVLLAAAAVYALAMMAGPLAPYPHPQILRSAYTEPMLWVPWQERFEAAYFLLACSLGAGCGLLALRGNGSTLQYAVSNKSALPLEIGAFAFCLVSAVLVIAPRSFSDIASTLTDLHLGSYLFAPAVSFLKPGAVPTVDFESHYGIGVPWLFSFFLGNSFEVTSWRAAMFMCLMTVAFHASVYGLCRYVLGSALAAFVTSLFILAGAFDGFSYSIPSDLPIRFVLCPVFMLAAIHAGLSRQPRAFAGLGALSAVAIWWQTDTGLLCFLTGAGLVACLVAARKISWLALAWFVVAAGAMFAAILVLTTGQISVLLIQRLIEPISLYSGGFGGVPMQWGTAWSIAYNVLTPVLIAASVAIGLAAIWRADRPDKTALALLVISGFAALALMKWVNRSIDVLWWLNGWPVVILVALWCRMTVCKLAANTRQRIVFGTAATLVCGAALFVNANSTIVAGLSRSPALRWGLYFKNHPSYASDAYLAMRGVVRDPASRRQPRIISASSTEFLRSRTSAQEGVVVLSAFDWHYLVDARRPSGLYWLPLHLTHSWILLERNLERIKSARQLFLAEGYWDVVGERNAPAAERIKAVVDLCFKTVEQDAGWQRMTNTCGPAATR